MFMKRIILALVLLCFQWVCFGQVSITGKVKDAQVNLPRVNILLLDLDSVWVKGTATNDNGEFTIEHVAPAAYLISASMIGYATFVSQIQVGENDNVQFDIVLEESAKKLDEFLVKAERQLFDQQTDRLVINLESSITSSGNTILEVLQKSPGVIVNRQNNSIVMNGKSGIRVMINNKIVQVPQDVLIQMLDGMNASNVEKIELITAPPSQYDAEGNAGIIHIVTKESGGIGTNGSIGITLGARWAGTLGGNLSLNHRSGKMAYFIDYAVTRNHNLHTLKMRRETIVNGLAEQMEDHSHRENVTTQHNLSAGIEAKLSTHTFLNLLFTGYRRNWDMNAVSTNTHHFSEDSTINRIMNIHESNIWQSAAASIGIQSRINSRSEIGFSVDYLYYKNENPSRYDINELHEQQNQNAISGIDLKKDTPIRFVIAKADYQFSVSPSVSWETGIKGVGSVLDNNVSVQRWEDNVWVADPAFTSFSTLKEQVASAYISTKWNAGGKWQINGGIRYEFTYTTISTPSQKNIINRKYGYFFPNLSVSKKLDEESGFSFSYSKRITRPSYNDIAPFVFFWSPNTFSAGNTSLYPAIIDAVTVGYHVKQWMSSLQAGHTRNDITFLQPEADSQSNTLTFRSQNLDYLNSLAFTNAYSFSIARWWEVQSNVMLQYQIVKTDHLQKNATLKQFGVNVNVINQFKLPMDFSMEVSGMYQSRSLSGISTYLPFGSLNAGIQRGFGSKGTIRLSVDDIFNTNNWRISTTSSENNLDTYFEYRWNNRFVRLTYTWKLGNNALRSVKVRSGSEEERGRVK
jgi:Outer membrane protein beta-barrel family/CarboxypepD_reg-like domain